MAQRRGSSTRATDKYPGYDIENCEKESVAACIAWCAEADECAAANWYNAGPQGADLNYCWLKSDYGEVRKTKDAQSVNIPILNAQLLKSFKADVSPDTVNKTVAGMLGLKNSCVHPASQKPYIKSLTGGPDNSPEGMQAGIQYGFVAEFENPGDRDFYVAEDKAHQAFKDSLSGTLEKVIVVDYSF
ncbi:hypothetical protein DL764_008146 [Monosporascus ibericus]|uniref:Stress-response A/B barrel domain-containing protein n=1 Tax=Monosporascus ibericus TaxID=155417 RepID=A0A4Q4T130_9PEZI|nr:hypothetical protein DL764_008146 [Monosporascus ibericus]